MSGTGWLWSISSEAQAARWPPQALASSRSSLLMTSSCFCAPPYAGAGAGDDRDQLAQVGIDAAGVLFLAQEAGQRSTGHERAGLGSGKTPIVAGLAGACVPAGRRNRFQMRCARGAFLLSRLVGGGGDAGHAASTSM
ncbi:hypothetical protein G6F66_013973 [Rhizopus arrhizus]|nr:hypothetical protein G6F66_013973 [Rhizopus arrhizus]